MQLVERLKRIIISGYYNLLGKNLRINDGGYATTHTVNHQSERCGWQKFGAQNEEEYEYWWQEACGIVSLRMIIEALKPGAISKQETIFSQIQKSISDGAYLQKNTNGRTIRIGWIHNELARIARSFGLKSYSTRLTIEGICGVIRSNKLVMASIYRPFTRFIDENVPRKKAGGHLAVVTGFTWKNGNCTGLYVADPYDIHSRPKPVDAALFSDVYSGSAIVFYK